MPVDLQTVFTDIYKKNTWASNETRSGGGSEIERTREIRMILPRIIEEYGSKRMLDAGCGDLHWFPFANCWRAGLKEYEGYDIVPDLVKVQKRDPRIRLSQANIVTDPFHAFDLILCRTVLFHLSLVNIALTLENFRRSGSSLLLMTTHPHTQINREIEDGNWRRTNFMIEPFDLPQPIDMWPDGPGSDGFIGLWNLQKSMVK